MLRITHAQSEAGQRWTLCGQLTGPWVEELRASWERRHALGDAHAVVDLSDVTFIDEAGEKLLREMRSGGAEFVALGVDTKHLLKHLVAKGERPLRAFHRSPGELLQDARVIAGRSAHAGHKTGDGSSTLVTKSPNSWLSSSACSGSSNALWCVGDEA